tara:strand:- start:108 stop:899 length:792 start_codon:yes stop_codon:yes gene_type:complete
MKEQLIIMGFIIGLIFCATYTNKSLTEGFNDRNRKAINDEFDCPNLLVRRGNKLMLLNNRKARIPGINPIFFDNLEDYVEFVNWQRSQNIKCPVLYFNEMQDAQGNTRYRMLNDPMDPQAGLPSYNHVMATEVPLYDSNMDHPPYNQNNYHGFDSTNQNLGRYTPLDKIFHSNSGIPSANAMDDNWVGVEASRRMVKSGKFNKDFRKDGLKSNSEFDGIITKNPKYNAISRRIGRAHPDPISAGAKTGDAERDRAKKEAGRLK